MSGEEGISEVMEKEKNDLTRTLSDNDCHVESNILDNDDNTNISNINNITTIAIGKPGNDSEENSEQPVNSGSKETSLQQDGETNINENKGKVDDSDEKAALKNKLEKMKKKYKEEKEKCKNEKERAEKLFIRLSEVAGSKLMDSNPAIADLSDAHRPQKLAEMIGEVYDNEWTDAFEFLSTHAKTDEEKTDKFITSRLLDILKECHAFCESESRQQLHYLIADLTLTEIRGQVPMNEIHAKLSTLSMSKLKDFRRSIAPELMPKIKEKYSETRHVNDGALRVYSDRCLECCWYACIQDPPLHLTFKFDSFDSTLHRGYRKAGKFVDFVVWPAIHIEEDGALLSKAVIEGTDADEESTFVIVHKTDEKYNEKETGNIASRQNQSVVQESNREIKANKIDNSKEKTEAPSDSVSNAKGSADIANKRNTHGLTEKSIQEKRSSLKEPTEKKPYKPTQIFCSSK